jgi:hypothetical protein
VLSLHRCTQLEGSRKFGYDIRFQSNPKKKKNNPAVETVEMLSGIYLWGK